MGSHFSSKDLSQSDRERIARELFDVTKKSGDELIGLCPYHQEENPSYSYNIEKDVGHCMSCDGSDGDLIHIYSHVKGLDKKQGYKAFCEAYQTPGDTGTATKKRKAKKPAKKKSAAGPGPVPESAWNALSPLPPAWLKRCIEKFGWSAEVITRFDLRLVERTGHKRIAIPIRGDGGRLRNIRLYLPGGGKLEKWKSWSKGGGSGRMFPHPSQLTSAPVYLCEGEKDTLCALSQGLNAVTQTCGAKSWKATYTKHFIDRDVIICYDADKDGLDYAEKRARELVKVAKSVRIIEWPKFMPYVEKHGQDLTDFFVTHKKNVADFKDLLATATVITKPVESDDDAGPKRFFGGIRGGKFYPMRLAQEIMDDVEVISDPEKELIYRWNGQFWEKYDLAYLRSTSLVMLGEEASSARAYDAANIVRDLSVLRYGRKMNDQVDWLCLRNGMFNINTRELAPFDKDYNANFQIGVEYDPNNIQPCEEWETFLIQAVTNAYVIKEIQKFFGYCLTRETRYEKAMILYGPGGDGKGKLLNILQAMVGEENCSHISLGKLENEFYLSLLADKLINVSNETENKALSSDAFKAIVSGDSITASYKHVDPFSFKPFCKMAYSSNKQPRILDNSDGFFRKVMMIEMKQQFVRQGVADIFLEEKLLAELPGIFAWALEGLDCLQQEGFLTPSPLLDTLNDYKRTNNPALCFVEDCVEHNNEDQTKTAKNIVYHAYRAYCKDFGYRPLGEVHFGKELHKLIPDLTSSRMPNTRQTCYTGIWLSDGSSPSPSFGPDHNQGEGDGPRSIGESTVNT